MRFAKVLAAAGCAGAVLLGTGSMAYAQTVQMDDGTVFDSEYYADTYPDLKAVYGYDFDGLLKHYQEFGKAEGRSAAAAAGTGEAGANEADTAGAGESAADASGSGEAAAPSLVPIHSLENKASLKKKCTDEEFQAAYDAASSIVTPLLGLSREEQLVGIAVALRSMTDSGQVAYSTSESHYNDPYGYLVKGVASCAGCTRTTGLCLNMLGISYEHVNENQWSHQWCRVNVDGVYWICDAYGLYVGPEPAPYVHPYL